MHSLTTNFVFNALRKVLLLHCPRIVSIKWLKWKRKKFCLLIILCLLGLHDEISRMRQLNHGFIDFSLSRARVLQTDCFWSLLFYVLLTCTQRSKKVSPKFLWGPYYLSRTIARTVTWLSIARFLSYGGALKEKANRGNQCTLLELQKAMATINWTNYSPNFEDGLLKYTKRLQACREVERGHFQHCV